MFGVLLLSALLLAPAPGSDHPPHVKVPLAPDDAGVAALQGLAIEDERYVEDAWLARAKRRWNRQCKHNKKTGAATRPNRCERKRKRLLDAIARAYPSVPHPPTLPLREDRVVETKMLLEAARKRAEFTPRYPLITSAAQAKSEVEATTANAKTTRAAADLALANARRDPYNKLLATEAILAEKTAYNAEQDAKTARAAARAFAIHHAVATASDAHAAALAAPPKTTDADSTVLELQAEEKLRVAWAASVDATKAVKDGEQKPAEDAEKKPETTTTAETKPEEKSEAEKDLDKLKAGKLIRWGITAGVAPAFYQPLAYSKNAASVPGMGALTYVMFHPGYWRSKPETNIYCANRWGGSENEAAAARAADDLAVERAKLIVDRLLASDKAGSLRAGEAAAILCGEGTCGQDDRRVAALARQVNNAGDEAEAARTTLTALVIRTTFDWRSGIPARCGSRMVGMWFGYPLKYAATVPHTVLLPNNKSEVRRDRLDVQPLFATGIGVSPNAYVSLLAGISLGKVNLPPGKDKDEELVVSFLFGIGGNLDLLGFLTK